MQLTPRQRSIIEILAKTAGNPVPVGAVSEKLGVSSRTVLRELTSVESWLLENGFTFIRKPGVGILIEQDCADAPSLEELLDTEKVQSVYSQKDRRRQILGELLFLDEPVKSYVFLSRFQISEGTLARDLDALDEWLSTFQIRIVRRPGVGILLEGSETAFRQAIANAALEFVDEGEILQLLREPESKKAPSEPELLKNRLISFIDPQIVTFVEKILAHTEQELNIK